MKRFLLFFAAALLFVACDNKFEVEPSVNEEDVTLRFTCIEDDVPHLKWDKGDKMSLFLANTYNNKFVFERAVNDNANFIPADEKNIGEGDALDRIYAVYPYDTNISVSNNGVISLKLSDVQSYEVDGFDPYYNSAVAVTKSEEDRVLNFKGIYGYVTIPLYGDATVESVEIRGNNGEKIAGEASITATYGGVPRVAMTVDATESITLDCGEGVKLSTDAENPTEFWFVVPPTTFTDGITIVATDSYDAVFVKRTSNKVVVSRNKTQPMAALEAIFRDPNKPAYNEIWYTSSDGSIVAPYSGFHNGHLGVLRNFGANIVSNKYKDGKGVITFDGDITTIGYAAFWDCNILTSVTIPDSVKTIGEMAFIKCDNLTSVTIPDSVTTIGHSAFGDCYSLTSVTIPDSVTTIGMKAFWDCNRLTSVYCKATTPPSLGDDAFKYYDYYDNIYNIGCTIYVPRGCGSAYKSAPNWSDYTAYIVEYDF